MTQQVVTFARLPDSSWGLRATAELTSGEAIMVKKKDGTFGDAIVGEFFTEDRFGLLYTIQPLRKPEPVFISRWRGKHLPPEAACGRRFECGDCGDMVHSGTTCWETGLTH